MRFNFVFLPLFLFGYEFDTLSISGKSVVGTHCVRCTISGKNLFFSVAVVIPLHFFPREAEVVDF